jgi:hypothetical protein
MDSIPSELVCLVFQFLPMSDWVNVMLVCKTWKSFGEVILVPSNRKFERQQYMMGREPIVWCCDENKGDSLKRLLRDPAVNIGESRGSALAFACLRNYTDIVLILLEDQRLIPDVDLMFHNFKLYPNESVRLLIDAEIFGPSVCNNVMIRRAIRNGDIITVKYLLSHKDMVVDGMFDISESIKDAFKKHSDFVFTLVPVQQYSHYRVYFLVDYKQLNDALWNIRDRSEIVPADCLMNSNVYGTKFGILSFKTVEDITDFIFPKRNS